MTLFFSKPKAGTPTPDGSLPILVQASGPYAPEVPAEITHLLASHQVEIQDMAQSVIQKLFSLSIQFTFDPNKTRLTQLQAELLKKAEQLKLTLEVQPLTHPSTDPSKAQGSVPHPYAITLLADPITAQALHQVTAVLAQENLTIDLMKRLSDASFSCVEMLVSSEKALSETSLRAKLMDISKQQGVDIALQKECLYRRAKRLVVFDMDSTLIQSEVIDELAREKGVYPQVSAITESAMMGKIGFTESLKLRCRTLEGLSSADLERVYARIELTPGAQEMIRVLKKLGYKTAVISGGFTFVADRLKQKLGIDFAYANTLEMSHGFLTGEVIPPIVDAQRKADLLDVIAQQERIELDQVIAVGDGANDLLMLEKAGLGIAFNAKPVVRERANLALSQKNMKSILYLLGLSERDVSETPPGP
ncbi:MAG: phosphoserine phosphatase SerB [Bdellovibrionia bacterium]